MNNKDDMKNLDNILPFPTAKELKDKTKTSISDEPKPADIISKEKDSSKTEDKTTERSKDRKKFVITKKVVFYFIAVIFLGLIIFYIMADTSFDATDEVNTQPININGATNFDFSSYREGYVIAKDGKISCYNTNQELQWEIAGSKTPPTTLTCDKYSLTYYKEDKLAVVTNGETTNSISTDGNVMYGSVNENGYVVLFTEESGLKNKILVYDDKGNMVFLRQNADTYIPLGLLSSDNKTLLTMEMSFSKENIATTIKTVDITEENAQLANISLQSEDVGGCFFTSEDEFIIVCANSLTMYNIEGQKKWNVNFGENQIAEYDYNDDDVIGISFANKINNKTSKLVFYNTNGKKLSEYQEKSEIQDIDICDDTVMLRSDNKISIINTKGKYLSSVDVPYDMRESIFMATKKCVFVFLSSNEARLLKID